MLAEWVEIEKGKAMTELVGGERRKKPSAAATIGEKSPETKPTYKKMETPALVSVISKAMIARNKAIDNLIASETEVRRSTRRFSSPRWSLSVSVTTLARLQPKRSWLFPAARIGRGISSPSSCRQASCGSGFSAKPTS